MHTVHRHTLQIRRPHTLNKSNHHDKNTKVTEFLHKTLGSRIPPGLSEAWVVFRGALNRLEEEDELLA